MPKYQRYGYVISMYATRQHQIVSCGNVAFHLNPKKALEHLDVIIKQHESGDRFIKIVEDTTDKNLVHIGGRILRSVLIEYVDGSLARYSIERWGVEVGRD
jgi:hypothetical protein